MDKMLHKDNVRMCLCLGWFHMLSINELENEVKRLEAKQKYITCETFTHQINKIKEYLYVIHVEEPTP
jgi:hypothetical protein